jgi:hypothetical protein
MVVDRRPIRHRVAATGRPFGEGLPVETCFAAEGKLVHCKLQVTRL